MGNGGDDTVNITGGNNTVTADYTVTWT